MLSREKTVFFVFGIYRLEAHEIAPPGQIQLQITSQLLEYKTR